jgi:hypothetical protein
MNAPEPALAAVDWAIATAARDATVAARARAAVRRCLAGVRASAWPDIAWRTSGMSGGGFPMEISCSWTSDLVRYTTEAAGPEVDPAARLAPAAALVHELGGTPPPAGLVSAWARAQTGTALRFGAWIGARHDAGGDRFKLYAEMPSPSGAAELGPALARPPGRGPEAPAPRLMLVGYEPAAARAEVYYKCLGLGACGTRALLEPLGLDHREPELAELLDQLMGRPARGALERLEVGVSLSAPDGAPVDRATLYLRAALLFAGDAGARERLLAIGAARGARLDRYAALTAGLADGTTTAAHGLVAVTVAAAGPIAVTVDLCPAITYLAARREPEPRAPSS